MAGSAQLGRAPETSFGPWHLGAVRAFDLQGSCSAEGHEVMGLKVITVVTAEGSKTVNSHYKILVQARGVVPRQETLSASGVSETRMHCHRHHGDDDDCRYWYNGVTLYGIDMRNICS